MNYEVMEVETAWRDNGNTMWMVRIRRVEDDTTWVMNVWGYDELDAYTRALKTLEEAS